MFLRLDANNDGTLSIDEIRKGLDEVMGTVKGKSKEFKDIMLSMDKDGNGVIDYQEFITAAIDKATMLNKENLTQAFHAIDIDKSGMITVDELKAVFDTHGTKDEKLWEDIMAEVDKNKDN